MEQADRAAAGGGAGATSGGEHAGVTLFVLKLLVASLPDFARPAPPPALKPHVGLPTGSDLDSAAATTPPVAADSTRLGDGGGGSGMQAQLDAILAREDAILALLRAAAPAPGLTPAVAVADSSPPTPEHAVVMLACPGAGSDLGPDGRWSGVGFDSSSELVGRIGSTCSLRNLLPEVGHIRSPGRRPLGRSSASPVLDSCGLTGAPGSESPSWAKNNFFSSRRQISPLALAARAAPRPSPLLAPLAVARPLPLVSDEAREEEGAEAAAVAAAAAAVVAAAAYTPLGALEMVWGTNSPVELDSDRAVSYSRTVGATAASKGLAVSIRPAAVSPGFAGGSLRGQGTVAGVDPAECTGRTTNHNRQPQPPPIHRAMDFSSASGVSAAAGIGDLDLVGGGSSRRRRLTQNRGGQGPGLGLRRIGRVVECCDPLEEDACGSGSSSSMGGDGGGGGKGKGTLGRGLGCLGGVDFKLESSEEWAQVQDQLPRLGGRGICSS
jgi:hypothetical protein